MGKAGKKMSAREKATNEKAMEGLRKLPSNKRCVDCVGSASVVRVPAAQSHNFGSR